VFRFRNLSLQFKIGRRPKTKKRSFWRVRARVARGVPVAAGQVGVVHKRPRWQPCWKDVSDGSHVVKNYSSAILRFNMECLVVNSELLTCRVS
jgi:hypothetical protein